MSQIFGPIKEGLSVPWLTDQTLWRLFKKMLEFVISIILKQFFILGANPIITLNMKEKGGMRSNKWINDWWSFFKMKQRWNTSQRINFLTGFFRIIPLLVLQKRWSLYRQKFWELLITNIHQMIFFVTKKKVKLIWIHFHAIILKAQNKGIPQHS